MTTTGRGIEGSVLPGPYPPLAETADPTCPPDVACVAYYRAIRRQARPDARQIGYGINRAAPPDAVRSWLTSMHEDLLRTRVTDYSAPADRQEATLVAELAGEYLGLGDLQPEHVVFTNGTTEAISMLLAYAAQRGMGAVLPLPLYCSFEQSAARHEVPVVGYYNGLGAYQPTAPAAPPGGLMMVDIAPNGVSGAWFPVPRVAGETFRVVDHVFAMPPVGPPGEFIASLRDRIGDLASGAMFMSPSKDLSVPGLRCGLIITQDPRLLRFLRADRFERGYSVQVGLPRVAALHLACLLTVFGDEMPPAAWARTLTRRFVAAGLPPPDSAILSGFRSHAAWMGSAFARSAELLECCDLLRDLPTAGTPVAGYSRLMAFARDFSSPEELTDWVADAGAAGLKLNPQYLFGGDAALWRRLHRGGYGLRVNVSVPAAQLREDLHILADLLYRKA
jgi:hypothetical protein